MQSAAAEGQVLSWADCWAPEALLAVPPPVCCQAVLSHSADASVAVKVPDLWNFGLEWCSVVVDWGKFHNKCTGGYPGCCLG